MSREETEGDIKQLVRSTLKISGLSLKQKEQFCNYAREHFNDSYAAYLTFLLKRSEDYERLLGFNETIKTIMDFVLDHETKLNKIMKRIKELEKGGVNGD